MINLKVDCSSEIVGIYPASRISSSNSDFAFFPQQMTTLWLNEFIREPLCPAGMLLFRLPSRIHPSPRKRPTILQKAGVKEVSVPSMHRYATRSPFTISPAFFHMHRPCRSHIQNVWLSVVMTGSQRPWALRRTILLLWLFMTALHFLNRPSFVRILSPVLISLIGFNPSEVRTGVSPSKQGNPPVRTLTFPLQFWKQVVVMSV